MVARSVHGAVSNSGPGTRPARAPVDSASGNAVPLARYTVPEPSGQPA